MAHECKVNVPIVLKKGKQGSSSFWGMALALVHSARVSQGKGAVRVLFKEKVMLYDLFADDGVKEYKVIRQGSAVLKSFEGTECGLDGTCRHLYSSHPYSRVSFIRVSDEDWIDDDLDF